MKKIIITLLAVATIAGLILFLFSGGDAPVAENKAGTGIPFGSGEGISIPATIDNQAIGEVPASLDAISAEAKIFRIYSSPTAGFTLISRNADVLVRFVDRATGNIFDISLATGEKRRLTNNTLPKIYEAYFKADGGAVLLRSLEGDSDAIKNLALALIPPKATSTDALYTVQAANLRGDIDGVSVSGNTLNYVLKNSSTITSSNFSGGEQKTLLSTPLTSWRTAKMGSGLLIYPKASSQASGVAYSLTGGGLSKIAGPNNGLTAISNNNGTRILYSYSEGSKTRLAIKNMKNGNVSDILPVSLTEKCIWSTKNANIFYCGTPVSGVEVNEPDNWYLGRSHYTDYIWKFDTDSEIAELIAEPKTDFGIDIDVYQPAISPNEDFMVFINKRDLTLWAIRLN